MRRLVLSLVMVVALVGVVQAQCWTNGESAFWLDANRFVAIGKVVAIGGPASQQALAMLVQDVRDGVAIVLPAGTEIHVLKRPTPQTVVIELNGAVMCGLSQFVSCK